MERMVCSECDHVECDPIGLDTETCLECGGLLEAIENDDKNAQADHPFEPGAFGTCRRCGTDPETSFRREQHPPR